MTNCRNCDQQIEFDNDHVSDSGKKIPLDVDTGEPHNCSAYASSVSCLTCGQEITFSNNRLSKSGKKVPLNVDFTPHQCKPYSVKCRNGCGFDLKFDPKITSDSGKLVPLELSGLNHDCPKNPFKAGRRYYRK